MIAYSITQKCHVFRIRDKFLNHTHTLNKHECNGNVRFPQFCLSLGSSIFANRQIDLFSQYPLDDCYYNYCGQTSRIIWLCPVFVLSVPLSDNSLRDIKMSRTPNNYPFNKLYAFQILSETKSHCFSYGTYFFFLSIHKFIR